MKKTYMQPTLKVKKIALHRMIANSIGISTTAANETYEGGGDANSNSFDDQETPWYRR